MLRFAADENLNNDILHGLLAQDSSLDNVRIQDTEMYRLADDQVLEWTARENRYRAVENRSTEYSRQRKAKSACAD